MGFEGWCTPVMCWLGSTARDREPNPSLGLCSYRFRVINSDLSPGKSQAGSDRKLLMKPLGNTEKAITPHQALFYIHTIKPLE